jgi:hypothetical protein
MMRYSMTRSPAALQEAPQRVSKVHRQLRQRVLGHISKGLLLTMLIMTTFAGNAAGDIVAAYYVNDTQFNYQVSHMPDFDQKRSVLPCGGTIHCVPTCASNMVAWAANHGFPGVSPGPNYWTPPQDAPTYNLASNTILNMGNFMMTSCMAGGTGSGNANAGLQNWLSNTPELVINDHLSIDNFAPTFINLGKSLCAGRLGSITYGFYDVLGEFKSIPIVQRNGGHCVTVSKIRRNGATRELWVRNPASDERDNTIQSPFVNDILTTTDLTVIVMPSMTQRTMLAVNYTPGDTNIRLVDGHRTITPAAGFSFDSSLGAVVLLGPLSLTNPVGPPTHTFPSPVPGAAIVSLDWNDVASVLIVVCAAVGGSPATLHSIDPLTSASQSIALGGIEPALLASGPSNGTYVTAATTGALYCWFNGAVGSSPSSLIGPLSLPHNPHAMVFDDASDELVLLSRTDRKLMRCHASLSGPVSVLNVPTSLPLGTRLQLAVNPMENGAVWLWSDASTSLYRLLPDGMGGVSFTAISHSAITQPRGLDFSDRGHLLVSNAGMIVELMPESGGGWQVVGDSYFAGLPADRNFRATRSRTNFTAGEHDTVAWVTNIDANLVPQYPTGPDCPADIAPNLNVNGIVNIDDLFAVILNWGECATQIRCPADISQNGFVNIDDLFAVILAWGPCP